MLILSRTGSAFQFTSENLFASFPKIYFWTFTFVRVPISDEYAMEDYDLLIQRLVHHFPGIYGIRVAELHRSHGIHFHCFLNERVPIERIKRISRGNGKINGRNRNLGFGRMSVTVCNKDTIEYLSMYLTKQYRDKYSFSGRRRWGCIGGWKPVRCRDIVYESDYSRNKEIMFGPVQLKFATTIMVKHYTKLWGHVEDWPMEYRAVVWKQQDWVEDRYGTDPAWTTWEMHNPKLPALSCSYVPKMGSHAERETDMLSRRAVLTGPVLTRGKLVTLAGVVWFVRRQGRDLVQLAQPGKNGGKLKLAVFRYRVTPE